MMQLPSEELSALIGRVLAKYSWTQEQMSKELHVGPHTVTRWKASGKIHNAHHLELLRLETDVPVEAISRPAQIPFTITIPRDSLKFSMDKYGNIKIDGMLALEQKEGD